MTPSPFAKRPTKPKLMNTKVPRMQPSNCLTRLDTLSIELINNTIPVNANINPNPSTIPHVKIPP